MSWLVTGSPFGLSMTSSREEDGERLVADEVLGHEHGVPEAELLALVDEGDGPELADTADRPQHVDVAALLEPALERGARVEMVLDRAATRWR